MRKRRHLGFVLLITVAIIAGLIAGVLASGVEGVLPTLKTIILG